MIKNVFVDSFVWIAAINKSDNYHEISLKTIEELLSRQVKLLRGGKFYETKSDNRA